MQSLYLTNTLKNQKTLSGYMLFFMDFIVQALFLGLVIILIIAGERVNSCRVTTVLLVIISSWSVIDTVLSGCYTPTPTSSKCLKIYLIISMLLHGVAMFVGLVIDIYLIKTDTFEEYLIYSNLVFGDILVTVVTCMLEFIFESASYIAMISYYSSQAYSTSKTPFFFSPIKDLEVSSLEKQIKGVVYPKF